MKLALRIVLAALSLATVKAEVPAILDYEFVWRPRPQNEAVQTYWLWRRVPGAPIAALAVVTTNQSSVWVSNVTTLIAYEWSITASNRLGMSDPSDIVPTPANPRPPRDLKNTRVRMKLELPAIVEQGPRLDESSARFIFMQAPDGKLVFTYCLQPEEPMLFWRWRTMTNATLAAPLPK